MRAPRLWRSLLAFLVALLALAPHTGWAAPAATATLTFTVNSTADAPDAHPGDGICADAAGKCTLRAAIQEADAQPGGSSIAIDVPADTYGLTLGTLHLTSNDIAISGALSSTTIIKGNDTSTIMAISPTVQARISQVTISGGKAEPRQGGGGLLNFGRIVLSHSAVISNTATFGAGIVNGKTGRLALLDSTLSSNATTAGNGGGIWNSGTLSVTDSLLSSNSTTSYGAGPSSGGGIWNSGTLSVIDSTLGGNVVGNLSSGYYGSGGGIENAYAGTLTLANSTLSGNIASYGSGGAIDNGGMATLTTSTFSGNSADYGGSISNGLATLALTNNTLSGNSASFEGGGIYNAGLVTLANSTIADNSTNGLGGGGGVYNDGGTMALTNSTISGNTASGVLGYGGGIWSRSPLTLTNTILAGNTAGGTIGGNTPDCSATLTSGGDNLVGIGDGCGLTNGINGDQVGSSSYPIDPHLGPLQDNGGPTQTMAPLAGSSAIDAVSPSNCTLLADQRGRPRPDPADRGACDIGAVETHYDDVRPPLVTGLNPTAGLYTGGTSVVIEGIALVGPDLRATVRFGGVSAGSIIADPSGTLITATTPATRAPDIVNVTVQTGVGTSPVTPNTRYTYTARTLYVAPSGRNTNTCLTPRSACCTIGHAVTLVDMGGTISAAAGTYPETVTIPLSMTLAGAGAGRTILDGKAGGTVVTVNPGATVAIGGVTIQNGAGSNLGGGGIYNQGTLALANSTLSGNSLTGACCLNGGGIYNQGTLTVTSSTFSGNNAGSGDGGGIYNSLYGTLTVTNSTLSGNGAFYGGGISNYGTLTMTNSTLSGNTGSGGGGIFNGGTLALSSSTVSGNSASAGGGFNNNGFLTITGKILAANTAIITGTDCFSLLITSGGYNLVGNGDGCGITTWQSSDQVGSSSSPINPLLGPLANNGGPTQTMALLPGSPAIDHGGTHATGCPATDQRGLPRPDEARDKGMCDIGAYESQGVGRPS